MQLTVSDIAQLVKGELIGDGVILVSGFSGIKEAKKNELTFLSNSKYEPLLADTQAGVTLVPRQISCPGKTLIRVDNPSLSFTQVVNYFLKDATTSPCLALCLTLRRSRYEAWYKMKERS